jgi:hypothetical protein
MLNKTKITLEHNLEIPFVFNAAYVYDDNQLISCFLWLLLLFVVPIAQELCQPEENVQFGGICFCVADLRSPTTTIVSAKF